MTEIPGKIDDAKTGVGIRQGSQAFECFVRAPVIDDDDFRFKRARFQGLVDPLEKGCHQIFFVEQGKHQGQDRRRR